MAKRVAGLIMLLSLLGGCSLIFDASSGGDANPSDDANFAEVDANPNGDATGDVDASLACLDCAGCCTVDGDCLDLDDITEFSCGVSGSECESCDPIRADNCGPDGCACGAGDVCSPGQHCANIVGESDPMCVCDSESCANGCCTSLFGTCLQGDVPTSCGTNGNTCDDCGARNCIDGLCDDCQALCAGDGCCSGDTCIDPLLADDPTNCNGLTGIACTPCGIGADGCSDDGLCICGQGGPCSGGLECVGGACVATPPPAP